MSQTQKKRWSRQKTEPSRLARRKSYPSHFKNRRVSASRFAYPTDAVFLDRRQQVTKVIRLAAKADQTIRFVRHLAMAGALLALTLFLLHTSKPSIEDSGAALTLHQRPLSSPTQESPKPIREPELRALLHADQPVYVKLRAIGLAGASAEAIGFELLAQAARNDRALPVRLKAVRELSKRDQEEGLTNFFISMIQGNDNVQIRLISLDWLLANREVTQDTAKMELIRNSLDVPLYTRFVTKEVSL